MTNLRKVTAGVLIALALGIFTALFLHLSHSSRPHNKVEQPVLKLAENLLLEDQQASLEGGNGLTPKETAMKNFGIGLEVEAPHLAADYAANEVRADEEYKVGRILVSGTVREISKDFVGDPYVTLGGSELFHDVQAHFADGDEEALASLTKGQKVTFVCEVSEQVVTEVMLKNCATVETYTRYARQGSDNYVDDVLSGKQVINKDTGDAIAGIFVAAHLLPEQSRCFAQADQECEVEIKAAVQEANQAERQELQQKANAFVANLDVR
jgi:MFS superfamily sulfate permease-like transporter